MSGYQILCGIVLTYFLVIGGSQLLQDRKLRKEVNGR